MALDHLTSFPGRRSLRAAVLLGVLLAVAAPARAATTSFTIVGHGYGHGVGMSQFGAQGYAQHGATYDAILAHYYSGTHLGTTPVKTVRVALQEARAGIRLRSATGLTAVDESGAAAALAIPPDTPVGITGGAGGYTVSTDSGAPLASGLVG